MKRLIAVIVVLLLILILPNTAVAEVSDWTYIPVPASNGDTNAVFFDTNTFLASDITVDVNGNLYVMSGSRIIRFTPDGRLDESWGNEGIIYDASILSSNAEQLEIVADSRGYVYAHCRICEDGSPTFIKRYTPDGRVDGSWYGDGVMGGRLADDYIEDDDAEPQGGIRNQDEIALDSKDNLYVLYDREVYRFLSDGTPDSRWKKLKMEQPPGVYDEGGPETVWFANALRIDWQDHIYIFNGFDQTVSIYNESGQLIRSGQCGLYYPCNDDGETEYLINQIAFDSEGNIYTNDDEADTISRYSTEFKLLTGWGENGLLFARGFENQQIDDFVSDTEGNLYLLDKGKSIVSKYTNKGNIDAEWGSQGNLGNVNGGGELMLYVNDIVLDYDGSIYIVDQKDYDSPTLYKLNSQFKVIDGWRAEIDDNAGWRFDYDSSVCAHGGYVYVEQRNIDVWKSRIVRLGSDGKQASGWEIIPDGFVHGMIAGLQGYLYLADSNFMIHRYTPGGETDHTWASGGILLDGFIAGMATDSNGYLYVCIGEYNRITRYTPEGNRDFSWGVGGDIDLPGSGGLDEYYDISSIATDDACNLYVSDTTGNRILRYDSCGKPDTSWCDKGEWKSADDLSNSLTPMINPTRIKVAGGKLYTVWNNMLYVMSDSAASLGTKNESEPQASATVTPAVTDTGTTINTDVNHQIAQGWWWVIGAGVLIISLATVFAACQISKKKKG
jgi:uncharacterized delta-60 repeat protein